MEISCFEAASYYDYHVMTKKQKAEMTAPWNVVVFHTDNYSVGFCVCLEDGTIKEVGTYRLEERSDCMQDILIHLSRKYAECSKEDLQHCFIEQMEHWNEKMQYYFRSEKQIDAIALKVGDVDIVCSELEEVFCVVKSKLDKLFEAMTNLWETSSFDEDNVRIILTGNTAVYYPIEYFIKEYMTFDPFLLDERFVNDMYEHKADQIIVIGEELYYKNNTPQYDIFLCVLEDNAIEKKKLFVSVEENTEENLYYGPIFIAKYDKVKK